MTEKLLTVTLSLNTNKQTKQTICATLLSILQPGVSNAYVDNDGSLVILNVNPKDATNFQCHATNKYGTDQATVILHVQGQTYSVALFILEVKMYACVLMNVVVPGPKVMKIFSCSDQLRLQFILLINVKF